MAISTSIRPPSFTEVYTLVHLDAQCFYDAWDTKLWYFCLSNYLCRVVTHENKVIGGIVVARVADQPTQFRVMKIFVKGPHRPFQVGEIPLGQRAEHAGPGIPDFRRRGISKQLMNYAIDAAKDIDGIENLDLWIPENLIFPVENLWCIGGWLKKLGFLYVETHAEMFINQGYKEDGQRWELPLKY